MTDKRTDKSNEPHATIVLSLFALCIVVMFALAISHDVGLIK